MRMEKLIKKQVTLSIFSFVLISILVIGTSVSYLRGVTNTSSYQSQVGKLDITFTNGSSINLITDPLEDSVAISNTNNMYDFKISNNGSTSSGDVPYTYKVYLESNSTASTLDTRFIKYCLIEGGEGEDVSSTSFTTDNCTPESISTTAKFNKLLIATKENLTTTDGINSITYRLKIWLSNQYGDTLIPNSVAGKSYSINILICGQSGTSLSDMTSC